MKKLGNFILGIEANERNMDPDVQGRVLVPFGGMNADFEVGLKVILNKYK